MGGSAGDWTQGLSSNFFWCLLYPPCFLWPVPPFSSAQAWIRWRGEGVTLFFAFSIKLLSNMHIGTWDFSGGWTPWRLCVAQRQKTWQWAVDTDALVETLRLLHPEKFLLLVFSPEAPSFFFYSPCFLFSMPFSASLKLYFICRQQNLSFLLFPSFIPFLIPSPISNSMVNYFPTQTILSV